MTDVTIRLYQNCRFSSIPEPDWLQEAVRISSSEKLDWQNAISRALDADHQGLTTDGIGPIGLDISFWAAATGTYVEIDSGLGVIEQVLIPDPADWLPFMSAHLTPLLAAAAQAATAHELDRIANALISFGRHGDGHHIDRWTGRSRIDEQRDREYQERLRARTAGKATAPR